MKFLIVLVLFGLTIPGIAEENIVKTHMKELSFMAGSWDVKAERYTREGKWADAGMTKSTIKWLWSNIALQESVGFKTPNGEMKLNIQLSYDQFQKCYRVTIVDNQYGLMDIYEGQFKENILLVTNERCKTFYPIQDGHLKFQIKYTKKSENSMVFMVNMAKVGTDNWRPMSKSTYSKK